MEITIVDTLPSAPSALIRVAIADYRKCVGEGVRIEMNSWLRLDSYRSGCSVCLAGAVMLQTLHADKEGFACRVHLYPSSFCVESVSHKLSALDHFRNRQLSIGFLQMGIPITPDLRKGLQQVDGAFDSWCYQPPGLITGHPDHEVFCLQMLKLADELEKIGQ